VALVSPFLRDEQDIAAGIVACCGVRESFGGTTGNDHENLERERR
jgi:hypothetical protein